MTNIQKIIYLLKNRKTLSEDNLQDFVNAIAIEAKEILDIKKDINVQVSPLVDGTNGIYYWGTNTIKISDKLNLKENAFFIIKIIMHECQHLKQFENEVYGKGKLTESYTEQPYLMPELNRILGEKTTAYIYLANSKETDAREAEVYGYNKLFDKISENLLLSEELDVKLMTSLLYAEKQISNKTMEFIDNSRKAKAYLKANQFFIDSILQKYVDKLIDNCTQFMAQKENIEAKYLLEEVANYNINKLYIRLFAGLGLNKDTYEKLIEFSKLIGDKDLCEILLSKIDLDKNLEYLSYYINTYSNNLANFCQKLSGYSIKQKINFYIKSSKITKVNLQQELSKIDNYYETSSHSKENYFSAEDYKTFLINELKNASIRQSDNFEK